LSLPIIKISGMLLMSSSLEVMTMEEEGLLELFGRIITEDIEKRGYLGYECIADSFNLIGYGEASIRVIIVTNSGLSFYGNSYVFAISSNLEELKKRVTELCRNSLIWDVVEAIKNKEKWE